jgi:hypothetical protein
VPPPAQRIAKWDGVNWSALGEGFGGTMFNNSPEGYAFAVFDGGGGPALVVGGTFLFSPGGDSFLASWGHRAAPACHATTCMRTARNSSRTSRRCSSARFQLWYRDSIASPCGSGFNLSHGLEVAFVPRARQAGPRG